MIFPAAIRSRAFSAATTAATRHFVPSALGRTPSASSSAAAANASLLRSFSSSSSSSAAARKPSLTHLIKELRSSTGAPMVECKKALSDPDVDGDLTKAADWLRKHGSAKASSKVSGREASEGMVGVTVSPDGRSASIVRVASETDFASRSDAFGRLVEDVAVAAMNLGGGDGPVDVDGALLPASVEGGGTVKDALDEAILAIRENLQISEAISLSSSSSPSDDSVLVGYVHGRLPGSDCAGTAAAVVEIGRAGDGSTATDEDMRDAGKKLAMHVVAAKPEYLSPDTVPEDAVEKEKAVLMEQVADSGKPPEIVDKMMTGRMRKYYEGVCLTEQPHMVEEGSPKVSKVLGKMGMEVRRFEKTSVQ